MEYLFVAGFWLGDKLFEGVNLPYKGVPDFDGVVLEMLLKDCALFLAFLGSDLFSELDIIFSCRIKYGGVCIV